MTDTDGSRAASDARCEQETYLEWGYPDADHEVTPAALGPFVVTFTCDGLGLKDCGWRQEVDRNDFTGGVILSDFVTADAAHRAHTQGAPDADCCPQVAKTGVCYCQEDDRG